MSAMPGSFDNLDTSGRGIAKLAYRPRLVVYAIIGCAVLVAWLMLVAFAQQAATARPPGEIGLGDQILRDLPRLPLPDGFGWFARLCLTPAIAVPSTFSALAAFVLMWMLMSMAMMLPSAAPMIRVYCDIAQVAARKGERAVHPLVLVGGYLSVWLLASVAFAALTILTVSTAGTFPTSAAGSVLLVAGAYQLSSLKQACLTKCRNPFSLLFGRWTTSTHGIFRLGVEQGLYCLGCCWALMLVMFAVGVMNIFWMALIGIFTLFEKETKGPIASRTSAAILLVWGAALLVVSL